MFRHARAAVLTSALAAAVLCVPVSAAAGGGEWWVIESTNDDTGGMTILVDAASSREVAPGVVELRWLTQMQFPGNPLGWMDARIEVDCAGNRARTTGAAVYGVDLKLIQTAEGEAWGAMLPASPAKAFVCQGERARYQRRADFAAPAF